MPDAEKDELVNGHRIVYRGHRFVCTRCDVRLLNMMQFNTRECPGPRVLPPAGKRVCLCPIENDCDCAEPVGDVDTSWLDTSPIPPAGDDT